MMFAAIRRIIFIFTLSISISYGNDSHDFLSLQNRVQELFKEKKPAVVRVIGVGTTIDPETNKEVPYQNIATGFFVSSNGHVLTSSLVVENSHRIWVEYEDVSYVAEPVGSDLRTSVAMLKVIKKPKDFQFLNLSDSRELPEPGSFVLAITCTLAFDPGPVLGMVNGLQNAFAGQLLSTQHIRSNIASDGGDVGAPVFDLQGRFIGMLAWSLPEIRGSFTLPSAAVVRVRDDLFFSGEASYGYLGMEAEMRSSIKSGIEVYVAEVLKESPAEEAGIMAGDIILGFNNKEIRQLSDLNNEIFFSRPGEVVSIKYQRNGKDAATQLKIRKIPFIGPKKAPVQTGSENAANK